MRRLLLSVVLVGCNPLPDASGFPDRGEVVVNGPATVEDICLLMDVCDLWYGPGSCESGLVAPERCTLADPYLQCMNECVEADTCLLFSACEDRCYDACDVIPEAPL